MRPAQIRVFDGLRITTDHVNHLQGALASGFEDFRLILGLSRPQTGLDVTIADDGTATIQPGTAFDQQKNRLACDAPLSLKVSFGPQDTTKFICLKYEQVEDNAVEGHPTMIWDSCSALVRDACPEARENLVVLAKVLKDNDGKLSVHAPHEACACTGDGGAPTAPPASVPSAGPGGTAPTASGTGAPPSVSATPRDSTTVGTSAGPGSAAPPTPADATPVADTAAPRVSTPAAAAKFRQGVVQLASDPNTSSYLRTVVAPALRAKMGTSAFDLTFALGQVSIAPDIAPANFTTHCVLSGSLAFTAAAGAQQPEFAFECVSHGEATPTGGGLAQFAASSLSMHTVPAATGAIWPAADFTGRGLAEFAFAKWSTMPDSLRPGLADDLLTGLRLVAQLAPADQGFVFALKLLWSGRVSEDSLKVLETLDISFNWQVFFGWKAAGS
jgi:hypothetical protein